LPKKVCVNELYNELSSILKVSPLRIVIIDGSTELYVGNEMTIETFAQLHSKIKVEVKEGVLAKNVKPQYLLMNGERCLIRLLELLSTTEELDIVWKWILSIEYDNEVIKDKLNNLREHHRELFNINTAYDLSKATYPLMVMQKTLLRKDQESNYKQINNFLRHGGYQAIERVFLKLLEVKRKTRLTMKLILNCLQLINIFLQQNNSTLHEHLWSRAADLINWVTDHCINEDIVDDYLSTEDEALLISGCIQLHMLLTAGNYEQFSQRMVSVEYMNLLKPRTIYITYLDLFNPNNKVRNEVAEWIYSIWDSIIITASNSRAVKPIFFENLLSVYLEYAIKNNENSGEYFALLTQIVV